MDRSALASTLEQLQVFLGSEGEFLLSREVRDRYLPACQSLLEKAREPGEVLYVGILGGTGVGKSMLINALARSRISDSSDRRPFTDRAVAYRHKDTPRGLDKVSSLIREPDALHDIGEVKDLVLLDLPDFDSVEESNRRTVTAILPELDSVVWVVSPEKYADAVFYDLVRQTHMHRDSFTFVFNKTDELLVDGKRDPHSRLKEVLGDLNFRLKHEAGIEQPRMFSVSAAYEFESVQGHPALDAEFNGFRQFLMGRRNAKEIASIKTVNLIEQTRQIITELESMIRPDERTLILDRIGALEKESFNEKPQTGIALKDAQKRLALCLVGHLAAADESIGSVRWVQGILISRRLQGINATQDSLKQAFEDAAGIIRETRQEFLQNRTTQSQSEMLLAFQTDPAGSGVAASDPLLSRAVDDGAVSFRLELDKRQKALSGPMARLRRLVQKVVLLVPVLVLLVKLGGQERIEAWLSQGGITGLVKILVGVLTSLFSVEGLVGLTVLGLCQVLLVWRMAMRRIRKTEREAERLAGGSINQLNQRMDDAVNRIGLQRQQSIEQVRRGLDRFRDLKSSILTADTAATNSPAG